MTFVKQDYSIFYVSACASSYYGMLVSTLKKPLHYNNIVNANDVHKGYSKSS